MNEYIQLNKLKNWCQSGAILNHFLRLSCYNSNIIKRVFMVMSGIK